MSNLTESFINASPEQKRNICLQIENHKKKDIESKILFLRTYYISTILFTIALIFIILFKYHNF